MMELTLDQWKERYSKMKAISDRVISMRQERFVKTVKESGLDPTIGPIHVHNALVGKHYGKPWKGINYGLVRKAKRIQDSMFESSRILEKWDKRVRGY